MSVVGRFWINPTVSESIKCSFVSSIFNSLWRESTVANNSLATYVFEDVIFSSSVDLPAFVIANLIQTYIAFKGYVNNKKAGDKK